MENESEKKKLRKQLAVAVRSIQWSYGIFWSLSTREQGVLEWHEGYYNGDIKTRKTIPTVELKSDKIALQRSEQLRELYKSLLEDETNHDEQQAKKTPSLTLSPEDLTNEEWYYLVCMSFVFSPCQGLPGRALAEAKTIWLCDAQSTDSKVFARSLLAKSASIQTVVCFPHMGGVIEIGVTDLVPEDHNVLQHIKASLTDFSKPFCTDEKSHRKFDDDDDNDDKVLSEDEHDHDNLFPPQRGNGDEQNGKYNMDSDPDECSNGCDHDDNTEDSFMIDDDLSKHSMNTSDCVSEAFASKSTRLRDIQNVNDTKLCLLDIGAEEDSPYKRMIADVLRGSSKLIQHLCSECGHESSFKAWNKGSFDDFGPWSEQKILKKILFRVPFMYDGSSLEELGQNNSLVKNLLQSDCIGQANKFENSRENENFLVLRSLVPSIHKTDKEIVLDDTIKYLKALQARVEELKHCTNPTNQKAMIRTRKSLEIAEQISDNYDRNKIGNTKKALIKKRKACDIDESHPVCHNKDGLSLELKVRVKEQEVLIDMKCPYKEYILLDIMDAINHLHLDTHSVQSSNLDGVFTLTLKSKFRGTAIAPAGMIKQALWKVAGNC